MESQTKPTSDTALPDVQQDHSIAAGVHLTTAYADADHVMALLIPAQTPTQDITILIGRSHGVLLDQKTLPRKDHQAYFTMNLRPPRNQNGFQHNKNAITSASSAVDTILQVTLVPHKTTSLLNRRRLLGHWWNFRWNQQGVPVQQVACMKASTVLRLVCCAVCKIAATGNVAVHARVAIPTPSLKKTSLEVTAEHACGGYILLVICKFRYHISCDNAQQTCCILTWSHPSVHCITTSECLLNVCYISFMYRCGHTLLYTELVQQNLR